MLEPHVPGARSDAAGDGSADPQDAGKSSGGSQAAAAGACGDELDDLSADPTPSFLAFLAENWPHEAVDAVSDGDCEHALAESDCQAPATVGRFRIERELGRGGFGVVYLAIDPLLARPVAIKVLHPIRSSAPQIVERFLREARATAGLDHPYINPVYETGRWDGGLYIALHYCPGLTLADWLRRTAAPVSLDAAARLVAKLARGLHYAHEQGILHRDLKPANILLERPPHASDAQHDDDLDAYGPRITDFGLAKVALGDGGDTSTGMVLGTPRYMAPEQAVGLPADMGPATDIYALGAVLYELLGGCPPVLGKSAREIFYQLQFVEPRPLSCLRGGIARDLETICLKCLEREPRHRYGTAAELAEDLERYLARRPIRARRPSLGRRMLLWTRRRPMSAALVATLLVAAIALPTGAAWHTLRLQHAFHAAERQRARAEQLQAHAEHNEARIRQHSYAADMRLAQRSLQEGDYHTLAALLDRYPPGALGADDRRGFEWAYLSRFRGARQLTIQAHAGEIDLVAFAADGRLLATSGAEDHALRIWDVVDGRRIAEFPTSSSAKVWDEERAAVSADGRLAAGLVDPQTVAVWDVESGEERLRHSSTAPILCLAFDSAGSRLAVGTTHATTLVDCQLGDVTETVPFAARLVAWEPTGARLAIVDANPSSDQVRVWELALRQPGASISLSGPIKQIRYSPDSAWLACLADGFASSMIGIIRPRDGVLLTRLGLDEGHRFRHLAFSADGRTVATVARDGSIRFFDPYLGSHRAALRGPAQRLSRFAFAVGRPALAAATPDGNVHIWDCTLLGPAESLAPATVSCGPVVFSPDGELLACAASDRSVRVIDPQTLATRATCSGHIDAPTDLAFSPDGHWLLTADGDTLRCFGTADGRVRWQSPAPGIKYVAWSPRHDLVVGGGLGSRLEFREAGSGAMLTVLNGNCGNVTGVRFLHEGKLLCLSSDDKSVRIWDAATRQLVSEALLFDHPALALAASADDRTVAVGFYGGHVIVVNVASDGSSTTRETPLISHPLVPTSLSLSHDGHIVAQAEPSGVLRAVDLETQDLLYALSGRRTGGAALAYSPDGSTLATVSREGTLTFWDLATWQTRTVIGAPLQPVQSLAFSPDGSTLAMGTDDGIQTDSPLPSEFPTSPNMRRFLSRRSMQSLGVNRLIGTDLIPEDSSAACLRFWDIRASSESRRLQGGSSPAAAPLLAWSATGVLAAGSIDGSVWIGDTETRTLVAHLPPQAADGTLLPLLAPGSSLESRSQRRRDTGVLSLQLSPDGSQLAVSTASGLVRLIDVERLTDVELWQQGSPAACLAYEPGSGDRLLVGDGTKVRVWSCRSRRFESALESGSASPLTSIAFSSDGALLALGHEDGMIACWTWPDREQVGRLVAHIDRVASLAFSADDTTLASGSWDSTVRLWSVATLREVAVLRAHLGRVNAVAFSPDGSLLASGGQRDADHGEVFLWHTARPSASD